MPKQIMVFLNSPHIKSALVDVPDNCELSTWILDTKSRDHFISNEEQLWVYSAISGITMIEAVSGTTAVQAMQAMESRRR